MKCIKCRKEIDNDSVFCEFCGWKVKEQADSKNVEVSAQKNDCSETRNTKKEKHPKLVELDEKRWYRFVKVMYVFCYFIAVSWLIIWVILFADSDDYLVVSIGGVVLLFEIIKRSFYYIYFGKFFLKNISKN